MKNYKKIIKGLILSLSAMAVAFFAIAVPFKLIGESGLIELRTLFLTEIAVFFLSGMLYLTAKEKAKRKKRQEKEKRLQRREKFIKAQEEYYSLAA